MAREEKHIRLRPVAETESPPPVIRLESKETLHRDKPIRLEVVEHHPKPTYRLDVPDPEDCEIRTHQPDIDALIEQPVISPDTMEQDWGTRGGLKRQLPWGWFVLMGGLLIGGVIWSLKQVKESDSVADKIVITTQSVLKGEAEEDLVAGKLVERIQATTEKFFKATGTAELAQFSRHPERVKPLMDRYYGEKAIHLHPLIRTKLMQPLTLDHRANFWMQLVELQNRETRSLIIEVSDSGEPKIDWETLVCYQPMEWDRFAKLRPTGESFDFRVFVQSDTFYSHEFADAKRWNCFRLTALDSEETLFGYAIVNESVSNELVSLLNENRGERIAVILRINVPEGLQSRSGVVIEKVTSPRWIFLDPPEG